MSIRELRTDARDGTLLVCVLVVAFVCTAGGCSEQGGNHEQVRTTLNELLLQDARTCDYDPIYPQELIDGIGRQLVEELRCIDESWLEFYTPCTDVGCINIDGPQPLAARPEVLDALRAAAVAEGDYITIRAAYRDVAMQYYSRWFKENCNSDFPAAVPGASNHQGGRAVDVLYYDYWWDALLDVGFVHPYVNDRPHFELDLGQEYREESDQLQVLSITAFQRLWNRNNPDDLLLEDGVYGPSTKTRLGNSPVEGFAVGACSAGSGGVDDATDTPPDAPIDVPPDANLDAATPDATDGGGGEPDDGVSGVGDVDDSETDVGAQDAAPDTDAWDGRSDTGDHTPDIDPGTDALAPDTTDRQDAADGSDSSSATDAGGSSDAPVDGVATVRVDDRFTLSGGGCSSTGATPRPLFWLSLALVLLGCLRGRRA